MTSSRRNGGHGSGDRSEQERLAALRRYDILDTAPEAAYDDVTRLAAQVCDAPISLITLLDDSRQWFKSHFGLEIEETAREVAFCDHAIRGSETFEVGDASSDSRFRDNPLVTGDPKIRFYAGVPLTTHDGHNLGTLCVIDRQSRELTAPQRGALEALARQVVLQLELRRSLGETRRAHAELAAEVERRIAEEEARDRFERFLRETIDALTDNIAIVDPSGTIVRVNAAWDEFARNNVNGTPLAAVGSGTNYIEVCDRAAARGEPRAAEVGDAVRAALRGDTTTPFSLEYPCHAPHEKRWFIVRVSAFEHDTGQFAVISHQNITQRKLAEDEVLALNQTLEERVEARTQELARAYESLRASEERFRSIFEDTSVGLATASAEGRLKDTNAAFGAIVGRDPAELFGMSLREIIHADDLPAVLQERAQLLAGTIPELVREFRFLRPDGEIAWAHVSVAAIRDATGAPVESMAVVHSIAARKRAEYERDRFFDLAVDMFVIMGLDGTVHRVNPACTRLFGYSEEELLGMHYLDLVHEADRDHARQQLAQLASGETGNLPYLDVRARKKDGEYRATRWSAAPWLGHDRIIAVGRDVTRLRESEDALRALAGRLQGIREEERTRISREIHDELGQLLTALKMDLSLFGRDIDAQSSSPPDRAEVSANVTGMLELVDITLKSVKRIAQELRPEVLDALGLVPAIESQAWDLQARTGMDCELRLPPATPELDEERSTALFRIYQEALTNVARHADASRVVITVAGEDGELLLAVRDDGRGFDPARATGQSLGVLGMRERAAAIGADFEIESRPGAGTAVTLRLRLHPAAGERRE